MKIQVYEIDKNGYIKEIHVADISEQLGSNIIRKDPPQGLYRAKWDGVEWIEDMTQEEIYALNNQLGLPTQEERIDMLENIILMIMEG